MASSQIGFASTSSPFGHVLRDHNLRDRFRDSNAAAFQNLKDFVHSISGQPLKKTSQNDVHYKNGAKGQSQNDVFNKNANTNGEKGVSQNDVLNKNGEKGQSQNDVLNKNGAKGQSQNDVLSKNGAKGLSQNDGFNKNTNANDYQIDHGDLWVHIPTYKVNEKNNDVLQSNRCDDRSDDGKVEIKKAKSTTSGGVSSLVRRWKDFEAEAKNSANNSPMSSSRAASTDSIMMNNNENESVVDMRSETRSMSKGTFGDSESDEALEKEKTRVVDIIRKLTSTAGVNEENSNDHESVSPLSRVSLDSDQQRSGGSSLFRGRQAFVDFQMELQRDRHKELQGLVERNAVSKFPQKGRIQAMLRVQFLRRGAMDAKDTRTSNSTSLGVNRLSDSSIKQLRERFKPVSQDSAPGWKSPPKRVGDSSEGAKPTSVQISTDTHQLEVAKREAENNNTTKSLFESGIVDGAVASNDNNKKEEEKSILHADCSNSDFLQERTNEENTSCSPRLSAETSVSSSVAKEVCSTEGDEKRLQPSGYSSVELQENQEPNETFHETVDRQRDWEEECSSNQYLSESENGWVSDVSHTQVGWEELHSDYEQELDGMQDWIGDVSRPRSEWEGLRKERYNEMLDLFTQKEDIRHLLESKSVSSFLSSGLRDRIDRLMICRTQQQLSRTGSLTDEQGTEEEESGYKVELEHEVVEDVIKETEGGVACYNQDYEDENQVEQQYQTSSSLQSTSRNRNHGPETSDCFDQVGFSPLQQDSSQNSYSQESRTCSSMTNTCSIEVQLIYELRGHMEKLHQEMSEIRKSIKSCMNNQLKLQRSVERNVDATLGHSGGQNRGRYSTQAKRLVNKSMCCICYDVQVDSLLYRCGHMCTCLKCAHELQQGSGRCPVCQAPILDVVRAHANS